MSGKEAVLLVSRAPALSLIGCTFHEGADVSSSRFHSHHGSQRSVPALSRCSGSLLCSPLLWGWTLAERVCGRISGRLTNRLI